MPQPTPLQRYQVTDKSGAYLCGAISPHWPVAPHGGHRTLEEARQCGQMMTRNLRHRWLRVHDRQSGRLLRVFHP